MELSTGICWRKTQVHNRNEIMCLWKHMTCSYARITFVIQLQRMICIQNPAGVSCCFTPAGAGQKFCNGWKLSAKCAMDPSTGKFECIVMEHDILISITQPVLHQAPREAVLSGTPNNIQSDLRDSHAAPLITDFLSFLTHFTDFFLGKKPHQNIKRTSTMTQLKLRWARNTWRCFSRVKIPTKHSQPLRTFADVRSRAPTHLLLTDTMMLAKAPLEMTLYNPRVPFFC